jgi:(E)-4-hydroxy-3-methylbut-2-enyl-diphosphate synthase
LVNYSNNKNDLKTAQKYRRLETLEVKVGDLAIGNFHPVRVQTMTTTDTMDTIATIEQSIRCIEAGAELVRITAPSKKDAENLLNIKNGLRSRGYHTPLVADIHFTPNAAEIAARIVEKVRVNPGNYVDRKKFEFIEYTDKEYNEEIDRIRERFVPLVKICKEYGTAMRIGTNHGSLSDRIMSRYGDTAIGMVESAMEFLRISRDESYHNIVLSMKSSNPLVMVQAYRLLVQTMRNEFGVIYPLHLGVTEAGDGEDGRIKSAVGIGTLMEDGIGDTIRVSLTEDPEFEIPVCRELVKRYENRDFSSTILDKISLPFSPFDHLRRITHDVSNIGGSHVPVVVADFSDQAGINVDDLSSIGYSYDPALDKWNISDAAADFIYIGNKILDFAIPGTLRVICDYEMWFNEADQQKYHPLLSTDQFLKMPGEIAGGCFVLIDCNSSSVNRIIEAVRYRKDVVLCVYSSAEEAMPSVRDFICRLMNDNIAVPVIVAVKGGNKSIDEQLIHFSSEAGALLIDGMGDGLWLKNDKGGIERTRISGRTYLETKNNHQFLNNTSFSILQATRTRISKTEYISCPSCGRTLFDLQETTAKIRAVTNHLKGVKIAIMGCIVNGPGEMADADFGYVGSGPGKITLYKGKDVVKRSVSSDVAVEELVNVLKENGAWSEPL